MTTALLIIDVQANLFDAPKAYRIDAVAALLDRLAIRARAAGWPVIFVQHEEDGCEWQRGTPGWAFHPALSPRDGDIVVAKRHCDAFWDTPLAETLSRLGVDRLVIGGYASDYCVDTTLRAAASRGLAVTVVADGHTTSDRAHLDAAAIVRHHAAIWSTFEASVRVVNSEGIDIQ